MRRALELAERGLGLTAPNPMVGAVVVSSDGRIAGEGWHEGPGTPHAEAMALAAVGDRVRGATLYVTLEPCAHQGRTPPCADALIDAGVARVVAAIADPNPVVDGRGFARLRAAGVEVVEGVLAEEAERLNAGFLHFQRTGLPLVTLKMAASLDGKVAARDGSSRWITGEAAREDVHRLRARSGAVVVGAGTARADDPSLTVRLPGFRGRQPLRVLVDASGRTPATGALFDEAAPKLVATAPTAAEAAVGAWERAGAEVIVLGPAGDGGGVALAEVVKTLAAREIQEVLIEGGPTLAWSAVAEGVVDRFVLYLAPKLIGGLDARGILAGAGFAPIARARDVSITDVRMVGPDLRVRAVIGGET